MRNISAKLQAVIGTAWEDGTTTDLTPEQAAEVSGYSLKTIRNAYQAGHLHAFQPVKGGRVRIPVWALYEFLSRPVVKPAEVTERFWATPDPRFFDANQDFTIQDERTGGTEVHVTRLADYTARRVAGQVR